MAHDQPELDLTFAAEEHKPCDERFNWETKKNQKQKVEAVRYPLLPRSGSHSITKCTYENEMVNRSCWKRLQNAICGFLSNDEKLLITELEVPESDCRCFWTFMRAKKSCYIQYVNKIGGHFLIFCSCQGILFRYRNRKLTLLGVTLTVNDLMVLLQTVFITLTAQNFIRYDSCYSYLLLRYYF